MVEPSPTPAPTAVHAADSTGPNAAEPSALPAVAAKNPWPRASLLLIPLCIGATLSGVITWLNIGFVDGFLWRWSTSFASALPVMALGFALMSAYDKLLQRAMPRAAPLLHKLLLAVLMALTLELLMSSVITLRNVGWAEGFAAAWVSAFVRSLPVGLAIGLFMGFVVRPRLQRLSAGTTRPAGA